MTTSDALELSPQQEHLWPLLCEDAAYRASCVLLVRGALDERALEDAVEKVIARHEILRTVYPEKPASKARCQKVVARLAPAWERVDLRALDEKTRAARLDALFEAEARRRVDLESGPIVRLVLAALAPDEHALLISLPALSADDATLSCFAEEIAHFHGGGAADELTAEPLQYADFAGFQLDLLTSEEEDDVAARAFFRERAFAPVAKTSFPLEAKAPAGKGLDPAVVPIHVPEEAARALAALEATGANDAPALLFAAFSVLLARMSGQEEVAVSYLFDGRTQDEAKGAMGLYARAIPVPLHIEPGARFGEIVQRAAARIGETGDFQYHFAGPPPGGVGFEIVKPFAAAAGFSMLRKQAHVGPFSVKLACQLDAGAPRLELRYDRRLYDARTIERLARSFERLLDGALCEPDRAVGSLSLVTDEERALYAAWNQRAADFPREVTLHRLFEAQAARTPDRLAVVCGDDELSYRALNERANRLARALRARGVGADARVGLCVSRSVGMIVGLIGILKSGGAYVPLLAGQPKARLLQQIEGAGVTIVVTERDLVSALPDFGGEALCLDGAVFEGESAHDLEPLSGPENLCYVIYTSGSTGVPKGVAVAHRNLVNYTHYMGHRLGLDSFPEGLSFATVSTLAADLGNTCIYPALVSGGTLHVIPEDAAMDGRLFAELCDRRPIDVLKITPSHLSALLAQGAAVLPRKYLITGGEACSWDLVRRVVEQGTCALINHYGPTETTIGSLTYGPVCGEAPARAHAATVPIGRPIANTEVHVLDAQRSPVPIGVAGELFIGGEGVTRGYVGRALETAERFVPNPFSADPAARLYRTGDRVRFLPDGSIEFLGRVDHQIKIRGYRVESAEIEAALERVPAIRQAVVMVREDAPGDQRLVAYLVLRQRPAPSVAELRKALSSALPEYMIPSSFVTLDELPLNKNGKVDRKALPKPSEALDLESAHVAPRNPLEEQIAAIWADVLRVPRVGVLDNFYHLGGHSLLATQVVARMKTLMGLDVGVKLLFEAPTVASLSDRILALIEGMSDEEAEQMLGAEPAAPSSSLPIGEM